MLNHHKPLVFLLKSPSLLVKSPCWLPSPLAPPGIFRCQVAGVSTTPEVMTVNMAASACERSGRWEYACWILSCALGCDGLVVKFLAIFREFIGPRCFFFAKQMWHCRRVSKHGRSMQYAANDEVPSFTCWIYWFSGEPAKHMEPLNEPSHVKVNSRALKVDSRTLW